MPGINEDVKTEDIKVEDNVGVENKKPTVEEQLAKLQDQISSLTSENEKIKLENERNVKTISVFETTLAEELDNLKKPVQVENKQEEPKKIDTESLLKKVLDKRKIQEDEFKKESELKEKESEFEKIKRRNIELEFRIGMKELIDKDPYLEDFIREGIEEKRFNRIEDVKMSLTPSVRKALQYTYEKSKEWEKAGKDPMEMYNAVEQATDREIREKTRDSNIKNWSKILGR